MGNSSSNQIQVESNNFFTAEEINSEINTVTWLQNQFLDLTQNNILVITESIVQSYELKSELNIHQFMYNIILAYRIRPQKSYLYSDLIFQICENLESNSANFKKYFLHYMTRTFNTSEPNITSVPYLSLLFRCYKKGIFSLSDIFAEIEYIYTNYSEFSSYLCALYCWFYFEIKSEKPDLFKSFQRIYKENCDHWRFPACLKKSIDFMVTQSKKISKSKNTKDDPSNSTFFDELDEMRENGFVPNSIFDIIRKDDISSFEKIASSPTFNPELEMKETIFIPYPILHYNPHLIQISAFFGSMKIFKFLLLNEANVECIDSNEMGLIHFAIAGGNSEIIRILEQNDVSFIGTPQIAAQFHQHKIFEWLIDNKFSDIFQLDPKFGSIAHNAAISNDLYIFNYLYQSINDNGADDDDDDKNEINEENLINSNNEIECINGRTFDNPNSKGLAPLQYAISNGCFDIVYYLVSSRKVDLKRVDCDLDNSLHIASNCGYSSIAKFILTMEPSLLFMKNKKGFNPIQSATIQGHDHILSFLLRQENVDINMATDEGKTLLHLAAENGHSSCIKVILRHQGVFLSAHDIEGRTPLHEAACKDQFDCVRILLEQKGIDINTCDKKYVFKLL